MDAFVLYLCVASLVSLVISCSILFDFLLDMLLRLCFYHNGRDEFLPLLFAIGQNFYSGGNLYHILPYSLSLFLIVISVFVFASGIEFLVLFL